MPSAAVPILRRFLPFDHDYRHAGLLGNMKDEDDPPNPPSYKELAAAGLIAPEDDPDRYFSEAEQGTATWLRDRGLHVSSVQRRGGYAERTPDAVIAAVAVTLETKTAAATENAILRGIRSGRGQSRPEVDARAANTDFDTARDGLAHALRQYGQQVDETS